MTANQQPGVVYQGVDPTEMRDQFPEDHVEPSIVRQVQCPSAMARGLTQFRTERLEQCRVVVMAKVRLTSPSPVVESGFHPEERPIHSVDTRSSPPSPLAE